MARPTTGSARTSDLCTCSTCGRVYEYDRRKGHTRRKCNSCGANRATREARTELKRRMVSQRGGSCEICGYNGSLTALSFHHIGADKRFSIAGGHNRAWDSICHELEKCVLLCQNCHAEVHDEAVRAGVAHWNRQTSELSSVSSDALLRICASCERRYVHDFRKGHTRRICNSCRSNVGGRARRELLKRRMIEYKGGGCQRCGYARCFRALCFHHRDARSKRFTIASSHLRSWASLARELDGCLLLCHNCHAGIHEREHWSGIARRLSAH